MATISKAVAFSFSGVLEQYSTIKEEVNAAIQKVLTSGWYILGREVEAFEREFAAYCGVKYVVGCASGTEAICLALMALGIKCGDEVITVANTAVPTISAISMVGATPVFVDVDDDFLMDVTQVERRITEHTKVIMPVHLYGQMADMDNLLAIARQHHLKIIEDACQAHGAEYKGRKAGAWGEMGCFSFYPTKNLGCYGDGGAVTTNSRELYELLVMLRNYGQKQRYYHAIKGINSRLDEIQAAILRVKLKHLEKWNAKRSQLAEQYTRALQDRLRCPIQKPHRRHVYHLYVIRTKERERLITFLSETGIETLIHYPVPVHLQEAYRDLGYKLGELPQTELMMNEILSLPIHPEMSPEQVTYVCDKMIEHSNRSREN